MRHDGYQALHVRYHVQHDGDDEQLDEITEQHGGYQVQHDGGQEPHNGCHEQHVNLIVLLIMVVFLPVSSSFSTLGGRRAAMRL